MEFEKYFRIELYSKTYYPGQFFGPDTFFILCCKLFYKKLLIFGTMYEEVRKPEQIFKFSIQMLCNSLCITQNILILQKSPKQSRDYFGLPKPLVFSKGFYKCFIHILFKT